MANMGVQPLEIDDLSAGITDKSIAALPNQAEALDNFVLEKHGMKAKPRTRPGLSINNSTYF